MNIDSNMKITFNDPLDSMLNKRRIVALNNILKLAQERVWQVSGRPIGEQYEDFDDGMGTDDITYAQRSIEVVERLLQEAQLDAVQDENNN